MLLASLLQLHPAAHVDSSSCMVVAELICTHICLTNRRSFREAEDESLTCPLRESSVDMSSPKRPPQRCERGEPQILHAAGPTIHATPNDGDHSCKSERITTQETAKRATHGRRARGQMAPFGIDIRTNMRPSVPMRPRQLIAFVHALLCSTTTGGFGSVFGDSGRIRRAIFVLTGKVI